MNIWQFAADNPVTAIILAILALMAFQTVWAVIFKTINRVQRSKNIAAKGWPPEHLDADGDFKPEPKDNA